jgi:hypothetical protein
MCLDFSAFEFIVLSVVVIYRGIVRCGGLKGSLIGLLPSCKLCVYPGNLAHGVAAALLVRVVHGKHRCARFGLRRR